MPYSKAGVEKLIRDYKKTGKCSDPRIQKALDKLTSEKEEEKSAEMTKEVKTESE